MASTINTIHIGGVDKYIEDTEARQRIVTEATRLDDRIDNIIAPSGGAPSAEEVVDARVGADGTVYQSLGTAIRTQMGSRVNDLGTVTVAQFVQKYTNFDNMPKDSIIRLVSYSGGPSIISISGPSDVLGTLITTGGVFKSQYYIEDRDSGQIYSRYQYNPGTGDIWSDWISGNKMADLGTTTVAQFASTYTNLGNMSKDSIIRFVSFAGGPSIISIGGPSDVLGTLITTGGEFFKSQYYIEDRGSCNIYSRYQYDPGTGVRWSDWRSLVNREYIIDKSATPVDDNSNTNNSLLDGLLYCYNNNISRVRVKPGVYNMVDEYAAKYGSNWDTVIGNNGGIPLKNISVVFDEGAKVVFNYTGGRSNIHTYLSLFNTTVYDCYVEGLDLECSNLRYGIHDDPGNSDNPYIHTFKNCKIIKTDNNTDWTSAYAIAGGLSKNCRIEIDGGIFKCENTAVSEQVDTMYYHSNAAHVGTNSKIFIHGIYCYGPRGTLHSGGQQQQDGSVGEMFVYNCRFNRAPEEGDPLAIKLRAWGNTIEQD